MGIFNESFTIYNCRDEKWIRTVVPGIQWKQSTVKSVVDGKLSLAEAVQITIPDAACENYRDYKKYLKLTDANAPKYWTLNPEDNQDFIIRGECQQEITEDYSVSQLKKDYYVVTVKSVADNRNKNQLKHIKVVCD